MARFTLEIPKEIIDELNKVKDNSDEIFGEMTKAGAEVVLKNVKANVPATWRNSEIMNNIGLTDIYKTPSDDGINTKVIISGYFNNQRGELTPAPLVANVTEYGSSKQAKHPFFRKSFKKGEIEAAMLKKQKELTGGTLE